LPDHAHEPMLCRLPKGMALIASPAGARVAEGLGFKNITVLDHGEETVICGGKLRIRATVGAYAYLQINTSRGTDKRA